MYVALDVGWLLIDTIPPSAVASASFESMNASYTKGLVITNLDEFITTAADPQSSGNSQDDPLFYNIPIHLPGPFNKCVSP